VSPRKSNKAAAPAPAGPYRKPRPDLYTVLLALSLIAILIGILFLYLEQETYEFKFKGAPPVAMVRAQGPEIRGQAYEQSAGHEVGSSSFNIQHSSFLAGP